MSNQDIEGNVPADEAPGRPGAPTGAPESLEQQLAKEREARTLMRDRLRQTEALAAESHALRARMAQELERVTADRDRLRTTAANMPAAVPGASATPPAPARVDPLMTPRASEWPLQPPAPPARSGPWRALAMLGGLAAGIAALAWYTGSLPGQSATEVAGASRPAHVAAASSPVPATVVRPTPSASALALDTAAPASASALPGGAVMLPPQALTPEQQLAAAPTAAGSTPAAAAAPTGMSSRLRKALDGEGIAAPVEVDAATGHVMVADPQSDYASRDRTDLVIRAVYAGANLPEPLIEHRWLSPKRGEHAAQAPAAAPSPSPVQTASVSAAAAYAARHAVAEQGTERHHKKADATVADAEELRPVVPAGRVTASCMASLPGKSTSRRADLTACMKHSCCSSANHGTEECRAYEKAYPFTCSAG